MTDATANKKKENETSASALQSCMLIINYLPETWDEERFRQELAPYKAVNTHLVLNSEGKTRCFGFAKFLSPADAAFAYTNLTGRLVEEGKRLKVTPAKPQDEIRKNTNVYIAGLPPTPYTTPELLRDLVLPHGTVLESRLLHDSVSKSLQETLSAFVRFARRSESDAAIDALNGAIISPPGTKKKWVINARYALDSRTRRSMFRPGNDPNRQYNSAQDSRGSAFSGKRANNNKTSRSQNKGSDASNQRQGKGSPSVTPKEEHVKDNQDSGTDAVETDEGALASSENSQESVASQNDHVASTASPSSASSSRAEALLITNTTTTALSHYPEPSILSILEAASSTVADGNKATNTKKNHNDGGANQQRGQQRGHSKRPGTAAHPNTRSTPTLSDADASIRHLPYDSYPNGRGGPPGEMYPPPMGYPPHYPVYAYPPRHDPYLYGGYPPNPRFPDSYQGPNDPYMDRMSHPEPYPQHTYPPKVPPSAYYPPHEGVRGPGYPYGPDAYGGNAEWAHYIPPHSAQYPHRHSDPVYPPGPNAVGYDRGLAPSSARTSPTYSYDGNRLDAPAQDPGYPPNQTVTTGGTISHLKQKVSNIPPLNYDNSTDGKVYSMPNPSFTDSLVENTTTDSHLLFPASHSEHDKFGHSSVAMGSPDSRYSTRSTPTIGGRTRSDARGSTMGLEGHAPPGTMMVRVSSHTSLDNEPSLWTSMQYRDNGLVYSSNNYGDKHHLSDSSFTPTSSSVPSNRWSFDSEERRSFPTGHNPRLVNETGTYPPYFAE